MSLPEKIFSMGVAVEGPARLVGYPNAYTSAYRCTKANIGGTACIAIEPKGDVRPLQVSKMFAAIAADEGVPCLLVCPKLSAYQRRSLSERGVAWVCDEGTFHIPFLAAACNAAGLKARTAGSLSAGAQQIAVRALDGSWDGMTSTDVAGMVGKSLSSVSSYFAQIAAVAPALIGSRGRTRFVASPKTPEERLAALERMESFMATPVKERVFIATSQEGKALLAALPLSGMSALSERTAIADDPWQTRAISAADKEKLASVLEGSERVGRNDSPDAMLEVWSYAPSEDDLVSLYLDVNDYAQAEHDERVQEAANELKEAMFR